MKKKTLNKVGATSVVKAKKGLKWRVLMDLLGAGMTPDGLETFFHFSTLF